MSFTAKQLYDRFHAAAAGKRAIGDLPLPTIEKESHAVKVGWDAVAWLVNQPAPVEAAKVKE